MKEICCSGQIDLQTRILLPSPSFGLISKAGEGAVVGSDLTEGCNSEQGGQTVEVKGSEEIPVSAISKVTLLRLGEF